MARMGTISNEAATPICTTEFDKEGDVVATFAGYEYRDVEKYGTYVDFSFEPVNSNGRRAKMGAHVPDDDVIRKNYKLYNVLCLMLGLKDLPVGMDAEEEIDKKIGKAYKVHLGVCKKKGVPVESTETPGTYIMEIDVIYGEVSNAGDTPVQDPDPVPADQAPASEPETAHMLMNHDKDNPPEDSQLQLALLQMLEDNGGKVKMGDVIARANKHDITPGRVFNIVDQLEKTRQLRHDGETGMIFKR